MSMAVQDRQRLFRDALAMVLSAESDLEVVATAATAAELVTAVADTALDVVVLELDTPDWDACRLVAALRRRHPRLTAVGTWPGDSDRPPVEAYQAGVRCIFPRSAGIRTLLQTVRNASAPAPPPVARRVVTLAERRPVLTAREVQVLSAIGAGATTRSVAASIGISPKTVEDHKQRIFEKLGVQNQAHAVSVALRRGVLTPATALFRMGA